MQFDDNGDRTEAAQQNWEQNMKKKKPDEMENPTFQIWSKKKKIPKTGGLGNLWITKGLRNPFDVEAQQGFYNHDLENFGRNCWYLSDSGGQWVE